MRSLILGYRKRFYICLPIRNSPILVFTKLFHLEVFLLTGMKLSRKIAVKSVIGWCKAIISTHVNFETDHIFRNRPEFVEQSQLTSDFLTAARINIEFHFRVNAMILLSGLRRSQSCSQKSPCCSRHFRCSQCYTCE